MNPCDCNYIILDNNYVILNNNYIILDDNYITLDNGTLKLPPSLYLMLLLLSVPKCNLLYSLYFIRLVIRHNVFISWFPVHPFSHEESYFSFAI